MPFVACLFLLDIAFAHSHLYPAMLLQMVIFCYYNKVIVFISHTPQLPYLIYRWTYNLLLFLTNMVSNVSKSTTENMRVHIYLHAILVFLGLIYRCGADESCSIPILI